MLANTFLDCWNNYTVPRSSCKLIDDISETQSQQEKFYCEHCGSTNRGSKFHEGCCSECGAPFSGAKKKENVILGSSVLKTECVNFSHDGMATLCSIPIGVVTIIDKDNQSFSINMSKSDIENLVSSNTTSVQICVKELADQTATIIYETRP